MVERRRTLRGRRPLPDAGNGTVGRAVDGVRVARLPDRRGIANGSNRAAPLHPHRPAPGDPRFRCRAGKVKLAAAGSSKRRPAPEISHGSYAIGPHVCCLVRKNNQGTSRLSPGFLSGTTRSGSARARWPLPPVARTPPRSPLCPEFWCGAAASPRVTAKAGNDRQPGEELHSSSMVSYRAKGINKFTFVNLRLPDSNRPGGIFLLAALVSTGSPPATARLLRSSRNGVTCHPSTRRRSGGARFWSLGFTHTLSRPGDHACKERKLNLQPNLRSH